MTDADADTVVDAAEDADPDDAEHEDATDSEQPDADELDSPDLPDDGPDPEEIEATTGAGAEDSDDGDDSDADDSEETSDTQETAVDRASGGDTMGELYCKMLVNLTNAMIEEHGKADAEPVDVEAARQADVGTHFDRLMDSVGVGRDLPPGQAVVLSTTMFVGGNLAAKTDVPAQMVGEFGDMEF